MTKERVREIAEQVAMLPPEELDTQDNLVRDIETAIHTALAEEEKRLVSQGAAVAMTAAMKECNRIRAEVWREAAEPIGNSPETCIDYETMLEKAEALLGGDDT